MIMQPQKIGVLVDAQLHNELVLRLRKNDDVSHIWENVMRDFLDRTSGDDSMWSGEYITEMAELNDDTELLRVGDPKQGLRWETVFLPNGTQVRMKYKGQWHYAEIVQRKLVHDGEALSPSRFASKVADYTSRNAWRDLEFKLPGQADFMAAEKLRDESRGIHRV